MFSLLSHKWTRTLVFSHLLFVVLIRNIPAGFLLMFWLKHLLWELWFLMDHQYSVPRVNLAGTGSIGCGGGHTIRWSYRVLSSAVSIAPCPTPDSQEQCWRLWPVLSCPMCQGHAHLNQVVFSVMIFHSQIPFSSVQYGMHQFCYLQTPVGFWFPLTFPRMGSSSFHTSQCEVKLITWYWHQMSLLLKGLELFIPRCKSGSADCTLVFEQSLHQLSCLLTK